MKNLVIRLVAISFVVSILVVGYVSVFHPQLVTDENVNYYSKLVFGGNVDISTSLSEYLSKKAFSLSCDFFDDLRKLLGL